MITKPAPIELLSDLIRELRRRELWVIEQQSRVDKFMYELLSTANFTTERAPKPLETVRIGEPAPYDYPVRQTAE